MNQATYFAVEDKFSSEILIRSRSGDTERTIARIRTERYFDFDGTPRVRFSGAHYLENDLSVEDAIGVGSLVAEVLNHGRVAVGAVGEARGHARPGAGEAPRVPPLLCATCGELLSPRGATRKGPAHHSGTPEENALSRALRAEAAAMTSRASTRRSWAARVRGGVQETRRLGAISRSKSEFDAAKRYLRYAKEAERLEHALAVAERELELLRKGGA